MSHTDSVHVVISVITVVFLFVLFGLAASGFLLQLCNFKPSLVCLHPSAPRLTALAQAITIPIGFNGTERGADLKLGELL